MHIHFLGFAALIIVIADVADETEARRNNLPAKAPRGQSGSQLPLITRSLLEIDNEQKSVIQ